MKDYNHPVEETIDFEKLLNYFKQQRTELHQYQSTPQNDVLHGPIKSNLGKVKQLVDYLEDYVAIQFHLKVS